MKPLIEQIGIYNDEALSDEEFTQSKLDSRAREDLYYGVDEYKNKHLAQIKEYLGLQKQSTSAQQDDPQFFRKLLIEHINSGLGVFPKLDAQLESTRASEPGSATIKMENFLGKKGALLYQLALAEEMHSQEYRNAVFRKSTKHYDGEKWAERPVIIVSGPSGCGKSFAADAAVRKSAEFLVKEDGNNEGNDVVSADGGVAREVSQMRKLVIQAANRKGFSGISDLHDKSNVLRKMKTLVREASFKMPSLGVVIPETFAKWSTPFNSLRSLMQRIDQMPNTKQIFSRVNGIKPSLFQRVVAFMGSRRAWKTSGFEEGGEFNLNQDKLTESKKYGAGGFKHGVHGSEMAERWYKQNSKHKLSMIIINDLLVLKEESKNSWRIANQDEPGATLISSKVYEEWKKAIQEQQTEDGLLKYSKEHPQIPRIRTSAQIDIAIVREQIRKYELDIQENLPRGMKKNLLLEHSNTIHHALNDLQTKLEESTDQSENQEYIDEATQIIKTTAQTMKEQYLLPRTFGLFKSKAEHIITNSLKALAKATEETKIGIESHEEHADKQRAIREELKGTRASENDTNNPLLS